MARFGAKSIRKDMKAAAEKASVIAPVAKKASELTDEQKIDYALTETKEPYQLKQRQDLAFHRFTQFCDTQNILLLHNVGSGKTVTSLSIALNVLLETGIGIGVGEIPVFKIITVTPTGLFNSFYSDLKNIANLIYGEIEFFPRDEAGREDSTFVNNATTYNLLKYSAKVMFSYNMFPGELYNIEYKQIGINDVSDSKKEIYNEFNTFISESVCIFDEAHRLLRPLKNATQKLLIDDMRIQMNKGFLSIKTIFMTGTPLSSSLNDTKKFISFITGNTQFSDIDNKLYGNCFDDLITIKNTNHAINFIVTVPTQIFGVFVAGSQAVKYLKNSGLVGTIIFSSILYAINIKTGLLAGGAGDSDNNLITMPPKNYFDKKISELLLLNKEQLDDYTLSLIQKNKFNIPNLNKALQIVNYDQNYIEKIFNSINIYFSKTITTNGKLDKNKLSQFSEIIYNNLDEIVDISKIISESNTDDLSNILLLIEPTIDYLNKKKVYIEDTNDSTIIEDKDRIEELNGGKINMSGAGDGDEDGVVMRGTKQAVFPDPIKMIKNLFPTAGLVARIKNIVGSDQPFNIKKFADDVASFISLSDSRIQDTIVKTTLDSDYSLTKLISVQREYQNSYEEPLDVGPIADPFPYSPGITPKFLLENTEYFRLEKMPISSNYPNKILNTILIEYSDSQIVFYNSDTTTSDKTYIYNHDSKNELSLLTRTIGNYSDDLLTVRCNYNIRDNIFNYYNTDKSQANLKKAIFCCTKFKQVFKMLLLMKCGYMYNFADTNKIISQSHFTTKNEDVPRETKDKTKLPLVYTDPDAVKNFLPLVYSISDFTGLGPFSAFIKSLGFEFILLHDLYSNKNLADELIKTSQKSVFISTKIKQFLIHSTPVGIDEYFTNLVEYALDNSAEKKINELFDSDLEILKQGNLCILLSAQYTEGLDMKYNPAIFLLEPANTYGDFDQLCGRVLRTYSNNYYVNEPLGIQYNMFDPTKLANNNVHNQDDFIRLILPNKIIYQVLCCTNRDYSNLELSTAHGMLSVNPTTVKKYNKTILPSLYFKSPSSNESIFWNLFGKNGLTGMREVINLLTFDSLDFNWWFTLIDEGLILEQFLEYLNKSEYKGEYFKGISDIIQSKICFDTKQDVSDTPLLDDLCAEVAQLSNKEWVEKNKNKEINICGLGPIIIGDFVDTKGLIAIDEIYRAKIIEIMTRYNKDNPEHKPIITRELRNALSGSRYTKITRDYASILRPSTTAQRLGVEKNFVPTQEKKKRKKTKSKNI